MRIAYVDEAGCTGALPSAGSLIQPVFVIAGVVVDQAQLRTLTPDFLLLKQRFFPHAALPTGRPPATFLQWVLAEIKGATVRKEVCHSARNRRRHALGFLDHFVTLLERYDLRIMGRLFVKRIGAPCNGLAVYTSSMQTICACFHDLLAGLPDTGIVIADSRTKPQNAIVAHSIFTQKFKTSGDDYHLVLEMPTFGHSENHIGVQIADLLCSALLFPMAAYAYCTGHVTSLHVQAGYQVLISRYGARLMRLQHRYQDRTGRWRGGIAVNDGIGHRSGTLLFQLPPGAPAAPALPGAPAAPTSPAPAVALPASPPAAAPAAVSPAGGAPAPATPPPGPTSPAAGS